MRSARRSSTPVDEREVEMNNLRLVALELQRRQNAAVREIERHLVALGSSGHPSVDALLDIRLILRAPT